MQNLKQRAVNLALEKRYETDKKDEEILSNYQNSLIENSDFDIKRTKKEFCDFILPIEPAKRLEALMNSNHCYLWGLAPNRATSAKIKKFKKLYFLEDAFLRSIVPQAQVVEFNKKFYQYSAGYIIDDLTSYFDATRPSRMETILNSNFIVHDYEIKRARKIIDKLIESHISKYNSQPIYKPDFGKNGRKKVLVVDQSYKDFSITKGCADDKTFEIMLDCAIRENPESDILIKTHPDTLGNSAKPKCYYQNVIQRDNILKVDFAINPISIIKYVDEIYVCTSQFGFEALMLGREVHTFGLPFYAGWGLTKDRLKTQRRTRKRSIEEIFYVAYILMTQYINPKTNTPCEIEQAIDYLIEMRERYFNEYSNISVIR